MTLSKIKPGDTFELAGETVTLLSKGKWECVVERPDGTKRYPRVKTVERSLAEQSPEKPKRARKPVEPAPSEGASQDDAETPELAPVA
jgi:hypothetical protein